MEANKKVNLDFLDKNGEPMLSVQFRLSGAPGYVVELSNRLYETIDQFESLHSLRLINSEIDE